MALDNERIAIVTAIAHSRRRESEQPMMNLRQMEIFHAVMEAGTVTGAANILAISQPAVTEVLKHTEDKLRMKLFERVRGRLEPTPEARVLFAEVDHVFERVRAVRRTVEDLREARSGSLGVCAIPALGAALAPALLGGFRRGRPDAALRFQTRPRTELIDMIASGIMDVGLSYLTMPYPRVRIETIASSALLCILPAGHPLAERETIAARDLIGHAIITYASNQGLAPLVHGALADARVPLSGAAEVGLVENAWAMVSEGLGVAVVDPFADLGRLYPAIAIRPFRPRIPISLEVLTSETRPRSRLAEAFIAHLRWHLETPVKSGVVAGDESAVLPGRQGRQLGRADRGRKGTARVERAS